MPENRNNFPKKIISSFAYSFSVSKDGIYAITLSARCFRKSDLRVEIDGVKFREIPPLAKPQYKDIPVAWNGTRLRGRKQTIVFLLKVGRGEHKLTLVPTNEAVIETEPKILSFADPSQIVFDLEEQAEDGDRRPWHTFALIDLPLREISADVTAKWRLGDSDDVKLIIDNDIQKNPLSVLHHNWLWSANIFKKWFRAERQKKHVKYDLPEGFHYIEFWADRMPTLHQVIFDLGDVKLKRVPTVDRPEWTGDFYDDTEQMILARAIFGEARKATLPDQARIGVAWSIKNRVNARRWGNTYHEVILRESQYSALNIGDINRPFVEDPLHSKKPIDSQMWLKCYEIAGQVMQGSVSDPTNGSNHYYDDSIPRPSWLSEDNFQIKIGTIYFHRL